MKLIHIADLHLGKKVNEFNLIEDQRVALESILSSTADDGVDGVIVAGDVFDKAIPSVEAVNLWDWFLDQLKARQQKVFVISGNHDSVDRLSFASDILEESGVFVAKAYDGKVRSIDMGNVSIYLLPYIKPVHVRKYFPDEEIEDYQTAVAKVIEGIELDNSRFNILVAHQFVAGGSRCDSEELSIGDLGAVAFDIFDGFDYVALGHLHGPQRIKRDSVRYSGSLLKYSFSEENHKKSFVVIDIDEDAVKADALKIELRPIVALRDMRVIKGTYNEVMNKNNYSKTNTQDYVKVVLTDEDPIYDCLARLRMVYPNIMSMEYDNLRTKENQKIEADFDANSITPIELIDGFFEKQNNQPMSDEQRKYCMNLIDDIWK